MFVQQFNNNNNSNNNNNINNININNNTGRFKTEKEGEKVEKYQDLKSEIMRMWNMKSALVITLIAGALDGVTKKLGNWVEKLGITIRKPFLQKTVLIVRRGI